VADRIITDFPEFYPMFAETEYLFDEKESANRYNRNPLLGRGIGADGLKTGHTQEAGYGLVGSAKQGDRRVIFALSGLPTAQARAEEAEMLINWSFRQFVERRVLKAGEELARAEVWMGEAQSVGLAPAEDIVTLLPVLAGDEVDAQVIHDGPVRAPVSQGTELGELVFAPEGLPETRVPLVATRDVPRGGFMARLRTVSRHLITRLREGPEGAL
jgi:D-alanyl-D-alanine carboxypeptidase (penicillin-binding protein 5/6)